MKAFRSKKSQICVPPILYCFLKNRYRLRPIHRQYPLHSEGTATDFDISFEPLLCALRSSPLQCPSKVMNFLSQVEGAKDRDRAKYGCAARTVVGEGKDEEGEWINP